MAAVLLSVLAVGVQHSWHADPHVAYDRNVLPAFDAHVYVAMAERPVVFTVAPWGYRLLTPALVSALPFRNVDRSFRLVTEGLLVAAAVGLFFFLRTLGHGDVAGCVGALAFALSGPAGEAVRYRYLAEPLTVALEVAFLWAAAAGAGAGTLAAVLVLGVWSKEFFVLLAPAVLLIRGPRVGFRRAARDTALAAAPAMLAALALRRWWTPHLASTYAGAGLDSIAVALDRVRGTWAQWLLALPLHGITPLALLGAFRSPAGRRLAPLAAYVTAVALVPPFLNPVAFFPGDVPRLLIYALPVLIPLALFALEGIWPAASPWVGRPPSRGRDRVAWAAALVIGAAPFVSLDRYRRIDLRGPRDGPYILALCRESIRAARRLERGESVVLDPAGFVWEPSSRESVSGMRWFLREGWGENAHYGTGDVVMQAPRASLILPVTAPRDMTVELEMESSQPLDLVVEVNGRPVGGWRVGPLAGRVRLAVPASALFRGDNVVTLVSTAGKSGARLKGLEYRPGADATAAPVS
jgi:hypothetical protein